MLSVLIQSSGRQPFWSSSHDCLKLLPSIFHQAMKGVAALVDLLLSVNNHLSDVELPPPANPTPAQPTKKEIKLDTSTSKLKTTWSKTVHSVVSMSVGTPGVYTSPSSEGIRLQHALADVSAVASSSPVKSSSPLPARPNSVCMCTCLCQCVYVSLFLCMCVCLCSLCQSVCVCVYLCTIFYLSE